MRGPLKFSLRATVDHHGHFIATTTKLRSLKLMLAKTLLLDMSNLARPLHPINSKSRNKRRNLWVGRCVSS